MENKEKWKSLIDECKEIKEEGNDLIKLYNHIDSSSKESSDEESKDEKDKGFMKQNNHKWKSDNNTEKINKNEIKPNSQTNHD